MIYRKTYHSYLSMEKWKEVLYAELAKVLSCILRAALLFWEQVSAQLVQLRFEINPYDWYVANTVVTYKKVDEQKHVFKDSNGDPLTDSAQMTIRWPIHDSIITQRS